MTVGTMTWLVIAIACVAAILLGRKASKLGILFGGFLIGVLATVVASMLLTILGTPGLLSQRSGQGDFHIFMAFFMTPLYWFLAYLAYGLSGQDGRD